ncbi:MAG: indolepyruvate ferredoxin oxidoreductase subunit alpha [Clostridia bacterium]|nr:indolepyruvate ferredoxin oxidoreductase subunit alpha [Clostridia bacterium]
MGLYSNTCRGGKALPVRLLMGNQAIAYGAVEAGVQVATGYPGTPSSEIMATLSKLAPRHNFHAEWSVNEKVALEVAAGAAFAGARAICTMKQVGLNVAADPLMTLAYLGVRGGLVLLVADDPGPHSSQNEQDTRYFAKFAKLPVLDPATPAEAREMTRYAFELSEKLELPVILRPTTRTCHAYQDIRISDEYNPRPVSGFKRDRRWICLPTVARQRHPILNRQQEQARALLEQSPFNEERKGGKATRTGIIACGVAVGYVHESLALAGLAEDVDVLKLGTPYPLPAEPVLSFIRRMDRVLVVEELEPVVEEQVITLAWKHGLSVSISGKHDYVVPREGELDVDRVLVSVGAFSGIETKAVAATTDNKLPALPVRPPVMCAGCPHRASYYAFKKAAEGLDVVFAGDIGCYTLGVAPPLKAVDTSLCMGASVTVANGLHWAEPERRQVAFLGDSTFFHTGIAGLINAVYNKANITVVVLDNHTTAMTGHQPHPGTGQTVVGEPAQAIDIAALARACGVEFVRVVDPLVPTKAIREAREAMEFPGPSVVVMSKPCVAKNKRGFRYEIASPELCNGCRICVDELGCPAILPGPEAPVIGLNCAGCALCVRICPSGAIRRVS